MSAVPSKGKQLTKDEVALLINLINNYEVITIKPTNAKINHQKALAWAKLTDTFNASISSEPRKPDQLRLKWENLKKAARKRATLMRRNKMKIQDYPPDLFIKRDSTLDRVMSMLDTVQPSDSDAKRVPEVVLGEEGSSVTSDSSQETPERDFSIQNGFRCAKRNLLEDEMKSRIARNESIANYYALKRKKIELEMDHMRLENVKLKQGRNLENK